MAGAQVRNARHSCRFTLITLYTGQSGSGGAK